jgi:predicted aldo/keto reductase-like oxidoreductase
LLHQSYPQLSSKITKKAGLNIMAGFAPRTLGKTGFHVSPIGIGGGGGIQSDDLLYAFDRGVNYFFYSSDLHHFRYSHSVAALRQLCAHGSAQRSRVVLATVSYVHDPRLIQSVIIDQLLELGTEYIDIFHWGWIYDDTNATRLLEVATQLKNGHSALTKSCYSFTQRQEQAQHINEELLARGLVRAVGMSFHSRRMALSLIDNLDVMMVRYNITQTEIETAIFPALSGDKRKDPGIVAFNTAHMGTTFFHQPPPYYPDDMPRPTVADCYRFALSNPTIDLVLTGVENRTQIDQALAAVEQGPLDQLEDAFLREYGSIFTSSMRKLHA